MAFGRGNGITIDIKAQISNLKEILAEMQKEIGKLDLGSSFGKSLKREADNVEKTLENLSKNSKIQITSETGVDSLNNKLTNVSDKVKEIGSEMQKVTIDNFSTEALENSIKDLKQEWENTKELLEQKINLGLVEELEKTPRLKKYLEDLGADVQNIDRASAQALLAENLERAGEEAKNAAIKLGELQEQYKDIKQQTADMGKDDSFYSRLKDSLSSLSETNFTIDNVFNPQALSAKIQQWESRIDKLNQYTDQQKQIFKEIITEYFDPAVIGDIGEAFDFKLIVDSFKRNFKESFSAVGGEDLTSFFNLVFGSTSVIKSSDIEKLFQLDPNAIEQGRKTITDILSKFKPEELGKDGNKIQQLLDAGSIEQAAEATIKLLRDKFAKVEEEYKTLQQNLTSKLGEVRAGALKSAQASNAENTAQRRYDEFNTKIQNLEKENQSLKDQLDALQKQIDSGKANIVENFKNTGKAGEQRGNDSLRETLKNTELYKTELDRVREKEKLVGKIEGIVQCWFSIYAAVRMVSNAIRSVISTVEELDKTITEIAIVTDMTQDDLWKQMSSYTDMARQYASSISGVYQVSQLYY